MKVGSEKKRGKNQGTSLLIVCAWCSRSSRLIPRSLSKDESREMVKSHMTDEQNICMPCSLLFFFFQMGDKNSSLAMVANTIDSGRGI